MLSGAFFMLFYSWPIKRWALEETCGSDRLGVARSDCSGTMFPESSHGSLNHHYIPQVDTGKQTRRISRQRVASAVFSVHFQVHTNIRFFVCSGTRRQHFIQCSSILLITAVYELWFVTLIYVAADAMHASCFFRVEWAQFERTDGFLHLLAIRRATENHINR